MVMPRDLITVLLIALLARLGAIYYWQGDLGRDPDGYRLLAQNLIDYGTFGSGEISSAYRPPLYPMMLVPCLLVDGDAHYAIAVLHLFLGLLQVGLTYRLCGLWGQQRAAPFAALWVALDPILLRQSSLVMTETLATVLALFALVATSLLASKRRLFAGLICGAAWGCACLCRPTFLPIALCAPLVTWAATGRSKTAGKLALCVLLGFAGVLAPWAIRNLISMGRPIVTTTHGGYTLYLANNQGFYDHLGEHGWRTPWTAEEFDSQIQDARRQQATGNWPADEIANDRRERSQAIDVIKANPDRFLSSTLVRIARFWSPVPHALTSEESTSARLLRYAIGVWYLPCFLLAPIGAWRIFRAVRWETLLALAMCLSFTAIHAVYWSDMRMRAPLMPAIWIWSATTVVAFARRGHSQPDAAQ